METLKYENVSLAVVRQLKKMTIDQMIEEMLNRHRERYAYHLINGLELKEMQRNALLYINDMEEQNPDWDLADIRTVLERETTAPYERRLERAKGTALHGVYRAQLYMVRDADFRETMLALYERSLKPGLEQFESYNAGLQELTRDLVYTLSDEELSQFTALYGTYRNAASEKRGDTLKETESQYAELIQKVYAFEQEYQDIIEKDVVNVRENIHRDLFGEPLDGEADVLKREEYGVLFPYLHVAKTLYTFMDAGSPDSYSG